MALRLTCRQVAELLIAREDQPIELADQLKMKLHLLACKTCPKFENQILTIRAAMGRWRNYGGGDLPSSPNNVDDTPK